MADQSDFSEESIPTREVLYHDTTFNVDSEVSPMSDGHFQRNPDRIVGEISPQVSSFSNGPLQGDSDRIETEQEVSPTSDVFLPLDPDTLLWYNRHLPQYDPLYLDNFFLGLHADEESIAKLDRIFIHRCEEGGIWELPDASEDDDVLLEYNLVIRNIMQDLSEEYDENLVPREWLENWVRALVYHSLKDPNARFFTERKVEEKEGYKGKGVEEEDFEGIERPESDIALPIARENGTLPLFVTGPVVPRGLGRPDTPLPNIIPLHHLSFRLTVYPTPGEKNYSVEQIASIRCLPAGKIGVHPKDYLLSRFKEEFEQRLLKRLGKFIDLDHGRLEWLRDDEVFTILSQYDFETAITHLYNDRGDNSDLFFTFVPWNLDDSIVSGEAADEKPDPIMQTLYEPIDRLLLEQFPTPPLSNAVPTGNTPNPKDVSVVGRTDKKIDDGGHFWNKGVFGDLKRSDAVRKGDKKSLAEKERYPKHTQGDIKPTAPLKIQKKKAVVASGSNAGGSSGKLSYYFGGTKSSNGPLESKFTEAVPFANEKDRREKIERVRRQFKPSTTMPPVLATQDALIEARGDVDTAFTILGGRPKDSKTPKSNAVPKASASSKPSIAPKASTTPRPSVLPKDSPAAKSSAAIRSGLPPKGGAVPKASVPSKSSALPNVKAAAKPSSALNASYASRAGAPSKLAEHSTASTVPGTSNAHEYVRPSITTEGERPKVPKTSSQLGRPGKAVELSKAREVQIAKAQKARKTDKALPPLPVPSPSSSVEDLQKKLQEGQKRVRERLSVRTEALQDSGSAKTGNPAVPQKSPSVRKRLESVFGKRDSVQKEAPKQVEPPKKTYVFEVTKMNTYKSGGDEDDAVDPLDVFKADDESEHEDEEGESIEEKRKGKGKDVGALLKEIMNKKELNQLTKPGGDETNLIRWLDCCRLFQIDPNATGMKDRVHVAGLRKPLFQYQAFAVYWQMVNSRRVGGGFVADTPGLGKTLTFLALLVVERQLAVLRKEVDDSRVAGTTEVHLPFKQNALDVCPSQGSRPGWIACPCAFSNPTSQWSPKVGVRIAILPESLMSNWRAQWKEHIDTKDLKLGMKLLLAHAASVADRADISEMADFHENVSLLRANKVKARPDAAKANQERFLVLTTAAAYDAWISKFKYSGKSLDLNVRRSKNESSVFATKYNIQFGIACADECHEDYIIGKGRAGVLARLPGNPWCWGYSGTPFDNTPRCLEGVLWALEQQAPKPNVTSLETGWQQISEPGGLQNFRREVFDNLCKNCKADTKSKADSGSFIEEAFADDFVRKFSSFLYTFMIRRTPDSKWFGHGLVTLKPSVHRDIFLVHNSKYDAEFEALHTELKTDYEYRLKKVQEMWDKSPKDKRSIKAPTELGFNNRMHSLYKFRILATCPALIRLTTGPNALTLKTDELKKWRNNENGSPYARNLTEIFESSPKLIWLRACIMDTDKQRDCDGKEQKMVIVTNFNCIAFLIKLMIERYIPGKKGRVGLMHADMTTGARTAMVEAFTDETTNDKHGNLIRKQTQDFQFLIGTTPLLSKGLQLTRACNVVLMEPDHEFFRELQGYARVNRIGQRNPCSYTYRLIDNGSNVEHSILSRQAKRNEFPGKVLKDDLGLEEMGPVDDGKSIGTTSETTERFSSQKSSAPTVSSVTSERVLARKPPTKEAPLLRRRGGFSNLKNGTPSSPNKNRDE